MKVLKMATNYEYLFCHLGLYQVMVFAKSGCQAVYLSTYGYMFDSRVKQGRKGFRSTRASHKAIRDTSHALKQSPI